MTERALAFILFIFCGVLLYGQIETKEDTLILKKQLPNIQYDSRGKADTVLLWLLGTPILQKEDRTYLNLTDFNFETTKKPKISIPYMNLLAPAALVSYGIAAQYAKPLKKLNNEAQLSATKYVTKRIPADDYIQFAPALGVYAFDLMGVKAKHNFRDRTILMVTSNLLMCATVQTMKHTTKVVRPDGSNIQSFPSGHTATAFVSAHILFKEYKDVNFGLGISGYIIATATGTLRIMNNKHWVSDVVAGAGIGILSAEVAYMLLPSIQRMFRIEEASKNLIIAPIVSRQQYGIGVSYTF